MGKPQPEQPKPSFPYKISRRIIMLSLPRRVIIDTGEGMPALTPHGVRKSAVRATCPDRVADAALPYLRRMLLTKRLYKNKFSTERVEKMDRIIEVANGTIYSKLANCVIDLKKQGTRDIKKKRGWSESEWKKHMDYIGGIAAPRKDFRPPAVVRGKWKPIDQLLPRINKIAKLPDFKIYKRLSQESWYRDPIKVPPNALKYVISDRVKKLATPRAAAPE